MKSILKLLWAVLFFTAFQASVSFAGNVRPLVDQAWLGSHSAQVTIVDVRDRGDYLTGHIPGAINIPVNDLQTKPDAILHPVPQCAKTLGEKGIDISREVVLYGAGREIAYLEFWMLDYMGMKNVHVLDGGIEQWKGELAKDETRLPAAIFRARPARTMYATTSYVRNALKRKNTVILDARTEDEYKGVDVRSLRGGHIPGAINIDFDENYQEGTTKLRPMEDLAKLYAGLDRNKEVIVYCQTGTRAANTFFVLKALGFGKVRNYDASWIYWGSNVSLPAEDVTYYNFVSTAKAIKQLKAELRRQSEVATRSGAPVRD